MAILNLLKKEQSYNIRGTIKQTSRSVQKSTKFFTELEWPIQVAEANAKTRT